MTSSPYCVSTPDASRVAYWIAVVVKPLPNYRGVALRHLAARGYVPFMPLCRELVAVKGKPQPQPVVRPLFVRYVFVGIGPRQDANDVRWVPGVDYLALDRYRRPLVVPTAAIEAINARLGSDDGVIDLIPKPKARMQAGQALVVTDGPFSGFQAVLDADEGKRLKVLVSIFGRSTPVELDPDQVRAP